MLILIVCHGNIHRSPMAEALLRQTLANAGIQNMEVGSRGAYVHEEGMNLITRYPTDAREAEPVLAAHKIEMWRHRSRQFTEADATRATLILAVDRPVLATLRARHPTHADKIRLLTELINERSDIADPMGGDTDAFRHLADRLTYIFTRGLPTLLALSGVHPTPVL